MDLENLQTLAPHAPIFPRSIRDVDGEVFAFAKHRMQHYLLIVFNPQLPALHHSQFSGEVQDLDESTAIKWCLPNRQNAEKMRKLFPFTAPQILGLKKSFGAGDRLGLAAAAHIRAARDCNQSAALVLAQQSMAEMARAQRTPDQVLDAATWGSFQEGFEEAWGANADGLKTEDDIRNMVKAGFTYFTIDASDDVDNRALEYFRAELAKRWNLLENAASLTAIYQQQPFFVQGDDGENTEIGFSEEEWMRAAVKYSRAISRVEKSAKLLDELKGAGSYDLEISLDQTDFPAGIAEHYFVANELKNCGVKITGLAFGHGGEFEKGADAVDVLGEIEARLKTHVAIAKTLGPYKISVYSDGDNSFLLPIFGRACGDLLHVKTSGIWYLAAMRIVARCDANLFGEICRFAKERFADNCAGENLDEVLNGENCDDDQLKKLFGDKWFCRMLDETIGAVLTSKTESGAWRFRARLYELWGKNEEAHLALVAEYSRAHWESLNWCP